MWAWTSCQRPVELEIGTGGSGVPVDIAGIRPEIAFDASIGIAIKTSGDEDAKRKILVGDQDLYHKVAWLTDIDLSLHIVI